MSVKKRAGRGRHIKKIRQKRLDIQVFKACRRRLLELRTQLNKTINLLD